MLKRIDEHIEFHETIDAHKSDVAFLKEVKAYITELEKAGMNDEDRITPIVGKSYYVQLAPRATLVKRSVIDVTERTVLLKDNDSYTKYNTSRYCLDEIRFVEECK